MNICIYAFFYTELRVDHDIYMVMKLKGYPYMVNHFRADSNSQWEMLLLYSGVSNWLGANLESTLYFIEKYLEAIKMDDIIISRN